MLDVLLVILATATAPTPAPAAVASSNREFMESNYPRPSLELGQQGPVGFEVTVERDGFMSKCAIVDSSGFAELDRGTCEFLARYGKMRPGVDANGKALRSVIAGRINWRLPAGSFQPAVATQATAPEQIELQCRRFNKTGTRVRKARVCMTDSEWALQDQMLQDELNRGLKAPGVNR